MYYLLGIDDIGRPGSADTASLALTLARQLEEKAYAMVVNISCHKLVNSPVIPFATKNISCCLLLDADSIHYRDVDLHCREFMRSVSSSESNPGFALAAWNQFNPEIIEWGHLAKLQILERQHAINLGRRCEISIAGFTGSGNGIIGALAAIGLRYEGNDGWISWMPGLSNLHGMFTVTELTQIVNFDRLESEHGRRPSVDDRILIDVPIKPVLRDGKSTLILKPAKRGSPYEWEIAPLRE